MEYKNPPEHPPHVLFHSDAKQFTCNVCRRRWIEIGNRFIEYDTFMNQDKPGKEW